RCRVTDFEVLVALRQDIEVKSIGCIGEENLRPHFRIDRLGVYIGKGDAENERAQVIDIRHPAKTPERTFRQKMCVLAALILPRRADAAIHYSHVVEEHVRAVARTSAEFSALRPAAFGIVFGSTL